MNVAVAARQLRIKIARSAQCSENAIYRPNVPFDFNDPLAKGAAFAQQVHALFEQPRYRESEGFGLGWLHHAGNLSVGVSKILWRLRHNTATFLIACSNAAVPSSVNLILSLRCVKASSLPPPAQFGQIGAVEHSKLAIDPARDRARQATSQRTHRHDDATRHPFCPSGWIDPRGQDGARPCDCRRFDAPRSSNHFAIRAYGGNSL